MQEKRSDCFHCGKEGHQVRNCWSRGQQNNSQPGRQEHRPGKKGYDEYFSQVRETNQLWNNQSGDEQDRLQTKGKVGVIKMEKTLSPQAVRRQENGGSHNSTVQAYGQGIKCNLSLDTETAISGFEQEFCV